MENENVLIINVTEEELTEFPDENSPEINQHEPKKTKLAPTRQDDTKEPQDKLTRNKIPQLLSIPVRKPEYLKARRNPQDVRHDQTCKRYEIHRHQEPLNHQNATHRYMW